MLFCSGEVHENSSHCIRTRVTLVCNVNRKLELTQELTFWWMRADFNMERGGSLHEAVKQYARDHGLRHSRAYPQLLRKGLESEGYDVNDSDSE